MAPQPLSGDDGKSVVPETSIVQWLAEALRPPQPRELAHPGPPGLVDLLDRMRRHVYAARPGHIMIAVDDLPADIERLTTRGVQFDAPVLVVSGPLAGRHHASGLGPGGIQIEICQHAAK